MARVDFEAFNKKFFEGCSIKWFDKRGVVALNSEVNAEIILSINRVGGHYEGYMVKIVNKKTGPITSKYFAFDDYLKERTDSRKDYNGGFVIIESSCRSSEAEWYIAVPSKKEIKKMTSIIMSDYLNLWR